MKAKRILVNLTLLIIVYLIMVLAGGVVSYYVFSENEQQEINYEQFIDYDSISE